MATYVFENVDNQLYARFKQFADSLGVGFQVIEPSNPNQTALEVAGEASQPKTLTEALLAVPTIDMPNNEDVFARVDSSPMRELDWLD